MSRSEVYAFRDQSPLSRQQFYLQYLEPDDWQKQRLEVGDVYSGNVPEPSHHVEEQP